MLEDIGDLGLSKAEQSKLLDKARSHVALEPAVLRRCSTTCPAHDTCPFIRDVPKTKRPYNKRCPIEAMRYRQEFENFVVFVQSMDPEETPIPSVEMGLCKEVAFLSIMEHRAKIELGIDVELTQDEAIAGAGGAFKKGENPSYKVFSQISRDKKNKQQMLYKMANDRLKRIDNKKRENENTLKELRDKFKDMKGELKDTPMGKLLEEAEKKSEENLQKQKEKAIEESNSTR